MLLISPLSNFSHVTHFNTKKLLLCNTSGFLPHLGEFIQDDPMLKIYPELLKAPFLESVDDTALW